MGPVSYLHSGLPDISGVLILPYCIGDEIGLRPEIAKSDTVRMSPMFSRLAGPMFTNGTLPQPLGPGDQTYRSYSLIHVLNKL